MGVRHSLPASLLAALSSFVAARMGLHYPEERWADLERGIIAAAHELGFADPESCIRGLLTAPLTPNLIQILAGHLTVGETYFFREQDSLNIFEQHIVPELLRVRHDGDRRLRIWSAGCCTGEEPYSIAMLLDRLIPNQKAWNITILATDVNPRFLRKAAAGLYSDWSFRGAPEWVRARHFTKRKDGRWELVPRTRNRVTFSYLNLADDVYPSLINNTSAMDVIFCRNVLMYFTAEQANNVVRNLYRALVQGGWLVVSPAETSNHLFSSFFGAEFPAAAVYRKSAGTGSRTPVVGCHTAPFVLEAGATVPEISRSDAQKVSQEEAGGPAAHAPGEAPQPEPVDGELEWATARSCANEGRLTDAAAWCEKALAADKLNPARHYLLAAIQQEQGQADAAVRSLVRALYLDSGFVLAHFALGNIELSRGRRRAAERHFQNTLALLRTHPPERMLPESEGLTAGRLVEVVNSVLASLPRAGAHV